MDVGIYTSGRYRDDALNAIAADMLDDGLVMLRKFNRNIGRYYAPNVRQRRLDPNPYAKYLYWVNYGRGPVEPVQRKALRWVSNGRVVFSRHSSAYAGSGYKQHVEWEWR